MINFSHKNFDTLQFLRAQVAEQLQKYKNKKQLANTFNKFFISNVENIIALIVTAIGPRNLKAEVKSIKFSQSCRSDSLEI